MKKLLLAVTLLVGSLLSYNTIEAQGVNVNININIGRQPAWGPVGYDYVEYYYFPDINCYFNVNLDLFYFFHHGRWNAERYLPYAYHKYDLYRMYKVVLVGVVDPWSHNTLHIRDYARYRGVKTQNVIRDSHDVRYKNSRNNKIAWCSDHHKTDHHHQSNVSAKNNHDNHKNGNNSNFGSNHKDSHRHNDSGMHSNHNNKNFDNKNNSNNNVRKDNNTKQDNNNKDRQNPKKSNNQSYSSRNTHPGNQNSTAMHPSGSFDKRQGNSPSGSNRK